MSKNLPQKDTACSYDPSTMRCVKHTQFKEFQNSNLCKYNQETGLCIKNRRRHKACNRNKLILEGSVLESRCPKKCQVSGLGKTTIVYLEQRYSLPKRWDMNYSVLNNGECIAVNRYGIIHEVRYRNNRILVNFGDHEAVVIPNK